MISVIGREKKKRTLLLADHFLGIITQLLFVKILITFSVKQNKTKQKRTHTRNKPESHMARLRV